MDVWRKRALSNRLHSVFMYFLPFENVKIMKKRGFSVSLSAFPILKLCSNRPFSIKICFQRGPWLCWTLINFERPLRTRPFRQGPLYLKNNHFLCVFQTIFPTLNRTIPCKRGPWWAPTGRGGPFLLQTCQTTTKPSQVKCWGPSDCASLPGAPILMSVRISCIFLSKIT